MIGTTLNGRFTLEAELGRGGMGAVYRALDEVLQRRVAVKILKGICGEEVGRKIRLEAQILARLVHDGIVRLYDLGGDAETYYLVMEEVDGTSFQKRWRKLGLCTRLEILAGVAQALDYAHRQGVIHRDVKPANVLLTSTDRPKLSDFGLSLLAEEAQESNVARGTPTYMSPEQARGRRLDPRTDLYSLGVILYECLTGGPPFLGNALAIMSQHVSTEPEPPSARVAEVPADLEALTLALLAKAPEARPHSGQEVAERLRFLLPGVGMDQPDVESDAARPDVSLRSSSSGGVTSGTPFEVSGVGTGSGREGAIPNVSRSGSRTLVAPPSEDGTGPRRLAEAMIQAVTAEPIGISPGERYLCGHYLAYLLGGSRRRGFLLRRPLDPLNADRARLLLTMAALGLPEGAGVTIEQAAELLQGRFDCRPLLTPTVVMKYLAARDTAARRKRFRALRSQLQQASEYAARHMTDDRGVLNPGLMPQVLDDLNRVAPARDEVDDLLVRRWNQLTETWRANPEFRLAVLRYATTGAWRDPAAIALWPEVVYPLIERARRQRRLRSRVEVLWDACGQVLHVGDAGPRMDQAFSRSLPPKVVDDLDVALDEVVDELQIEEPTFESAPEPEPATPSVVVSVPIDARNLIDLDAEDESVGVVRLVDPEPTRLTLGELREQWREAVATLRSASAGASLGRGGGRHVALGPYRLVVVATVRARSAGQVAIQGMVNKQVELLVPSFTGGGPNTKPVVAAWVYQNNSLAITHLDNLNQQRYVLWDAVLGRQTNFDRPEDLNHTLLQVGLEAPDALGEVLSTRYRPRKPV